MSSKNCSTDAAVLVPTPKSINSAPKETTPSGTLIRPDAIPDTNAVAPDTSLFSSATSKLVSSNSFDVAKSFLFSD
jgi:hypothetical protein